jgi:hypothetical protein
MKKGKWTKLWEKERAKLKKEFEEKGICYCELGFDDCFRNNFLGFAHRHKRIFYRSSPELLGDFNQVILACQNCHDIIEKDRIKTEEEFLKLRGEEFDKK